VVNPVTHAHFGGSIAPIPFTNIPIYIAVTAFVMNAVVSVVFTLIFRALKVKDGRDSTTRSDYGADEHDPKVLSELQPTTPVVSESNSPMA
jgi:SSS family solute:Na+ symporter